MPDRDATLDEFLNVGEDEESEAASEESESASEESESASEESQKTPTSGNSTDESSDHTEVDAESPTADASPVTPSGGEAVDPAEGTYRWTGDGARCDGCGAHVEQLWRDDAGLVCDDCKEW